jgi:hypothetical protein
LIPFQDVDHTLMVGTGVPAGASDIGLLNARWYLIEKMPVDEPAEETRDFVGETRISVVPDLVRKEALAAVIAVAVLMVLSAVADAPIEGPADIAGIPAERVKAPWVFVGIQLLLRHFPTDLAGIVIPVSAVAVLASIPYLPKRAAVVTAGLFCIDVVAAAVLTLWGYFG